MKPGDIISVKGKFYVVCKAKGDYVGCEGCTAAEKPELCAVMPSCGAKKSKFIFKRKYNKSNVLSGTKYW
jgi:hypothetical protein